MARAALIQTVTRALACLVLALLVAAAAAMVLAASGRSVDRALWVFAVVLLVSALSIVVIPRMTTAIARIAFPGNARLDPALPLSNAEVLALRQRLERVERLALVGELSATVAHEIKNPLAPIRGYAQLLADKLDGLSPERRAMFEKGLGIIQQEVDRIDRRIAELLGLARARLEPSTHFDLNGVVLEAIAVAEGECQAAEIVHRLDPELGAAAGDGEAIRAALLNLLKNALEAMEGQLTPRIEVTTRRAGDRAVVEVLDEGPGLLQGDAERAFQAFYTTKPGGTGLGLAIARSAVEAAGGRLTLASRSDRRGAAAQIELLRADEGPAREGQTLGRDESEVPRLA